MYFYNNGFLLLAQDGIFNKNKEQNLCIPAKRPFFLFFSRFSVIIVLEVIKMDYFSLTDIKKKNRSDVFHYIYRNPCCSRQGIATALSMSLPTVTQHLVDLMDKGLIEKKGQLHSSIGRKAAAYSVVENARISLGIEILSDKVFLTALDLYGQKVAKEKCSLSFRPEPSYFEELKDLVTSFLLQNRFREDQILGAGLGIQGLVSPDEKTITYGKILNSAGLSIDLFEQYFSFPCRFIHDAECAANRELWENPDLTDAIYLSLGDHLGGAIILDRKLQRGISGKSGTFEHMTLIPDGLPCYCGKKGCAESYCSASALLEGRMDLEEFFNRKSKGDTLCLLKWQEYLRYLSLLINNLHRVLESSVILGGHITPFFTDRDLDILCEQTAKLCAFSEPASYIMVGKCRSDAVSTGAALPFIQEFLQNITFSAEQV